MKLNEYQEQAREFRLESANPIYAAMNLGAEAGEVQGKISKAIRDGFPTDPDKIAKWNDALAHELGDVLWSLAAIADDNGLTLEEIAQMNIEKLSDRKTRNVISGSGDNR